VWTGKADAYVLEPLRERRAEIHRGARGDDVSSRSEKPDIRQQS